MVNLDNLRNKINSKVFNNLGSTLSVVALSTSTDSKWGDNTIISSSLSTVTAVPWMHIANRESFQPFGTLQEGEVDIAFKYDQTISIGNRVFGNVLTGSYLITEIENYPIANGILVKVARLKKEII